MTDSQWKNVGLAGVLAHEPQSAGPLSWPAPLISVPWGRSFVAQDTLFNGRRILLEHHTGGSNEWQVGNFAVGDAEVTQEYPEASTWRNVMRSRCQLAPGQALEVRAIVIPSGLSQVEVPTAVWDPYGTGGRIRITADYDNGTDTASAVFEVGPPTIPSSEEDDGFELTGDGESWEGIKHISNYPHTIDPAHGLTAAEVAKWCEWPTVDITLAFKGGIRCVSLNVSEVPNKHVVEHDAASSLHDARGVLPPLNFPQTKEVDGATYDEPRFGTQRGLDVAERQEKRVGPAIFSWGSHAERLAEVTDVDPDPVIVTNTGWQGLLDGAAQEGWNADAVGWDISAAYAHQAPTNLTTRLRGNAAVLPVRLRAFARFSTDAATAIGYIRFATSARSWLDLAIPEESTWGWYSTTGYLEANVSSKDHAALLQVLRRVTAAQMEIRYLAAHFGEFSVGLI